MNTGYTLGSWARISPISSSRLFLLFPPPREPSRKPSERGTDIARPRASLLLLLHAAGHRSGGDAQSAITWWLKTTADGGDAIQDTGQKSLVLIY
jgi:hypothetical protein